MAGTRSAGKGKKAEANGTDHEENTYEKIMGIESSGEASQKAGGGVDALSKRLINFRKWCTNEAKIKIHPSICIVNGEATDGTKNAPIFAFETTNQNQPGAAKTSGRVGMVDGAADRALYERTMGCQIWTSRDIKKDEVMMTCPKSAMITPDLVAASDAGRAVLACCQTPGEGSGSNYWDYFENTTVCESKYAQKTAMNKGEQLLINTLRDRTKAERAFSKATKTDESEKSYNLVSFGDISTRAPFLAFLIHQRFSSHASPPVKTEANPDFQNIAEGTDSNAIGRANEAQPLEETPSSFGPYARTLPSTVSLPICWERNELSMLSGCMPGVAPLQEIASTTMQLAAEFIALVNAGILTRFPTVFSRGMITWERWVWAYSVFTSRILPASTYFDDRDQMADSDEILYSPIHVWNELGVLIPFLDMVNHEVDAQSILWQPSVPSTKERSGSENDDSAHLPRAVMTKRVKKQQQVYFCYGGDNLSNKEMMLDYGFAQIHNPADFAGFGWGLMDAIGNVQPPAELSPLLKSNEEVTKFLVYESNDSKAINEWWSDERLTLLEKEAFPAVENSFMSSLKMGNKMVTNARLDGLFDPILLTASLVSSMPNPELQELMSKIKSSDNGKSPVVVSKRHQRVLQSYLIFLLSRKLEKLLENLSKGLKNHYGSLRLWTKVSEGGIRYVSNEDQTADVYTGWQAFFDQNAYAATMEVEKNYYSLTPQSCVLTLIDGQLQSLQRSIDNLLTWEKFESGVLKQLNDLGFTIMSDEEEAKAAKDSMNGKRKSNEDSKTSPKKKNRKKKNNSISNVATGDRPTAIKLHIGNLSYSTTPSDLFDFFSRDYGRDNVLECHIPAERTTGKSRGFGFVTLPEAIAREVIDSGRKCEINGRILKVAESNSAGTNKPNRHPEAAPPVSNDRCGVCGFRPKYCECKTGPNVPEKKGSSGHGNGPSSSDRDYDHYGRDRYRRDSRHSRSASPYRRRSERDDYYRDYSRDRDRRYYDYDYDDRSRSRSRSRGRERRRDGRRDRKDRSSRDRSGDRYEMSRDRDRSRDRYRGRSRSRSRERSHDRSRERSGDRDRGRSGDRSRDRERSRDRRERHSKDHRSRGRRSPSPNKGDNDSENEGRKSNDINSPENPKSNNGSTERGHESRRRRSRSRSRSRERSKKSRRKKRRARSRSRSASEGSFSNK